jgi:hypothetical protein
MRWLFVFMLIAFLFNGFDAGKHVFGAVMEKQEYVKMAGMDCCPDSKKEHKTATMACHYCCSGLLAFTRTMLFQSNQIPEHYAFSALADLTGKSQDGLFRPPRLS